MTLKFTVSFSFVVPPAIVCCHSLSFVVTRWHSLYHSLSFVVPLVVIRCHSLSFVVNRCTNLCHSLSLDVFIYLFIYLFILSELSLKLTKTSRIHIAEHLHKNIATQNIINECLLKSTT